MPAHSRLGTYMPGRGAHLSLVNDVVIRWGMTAHAKDAAAGRNRQQTKTIKKGKNFPVLIKLFLRAFFGVILDEQNYFLHRGVKTCLVGRLHHHPDQTFGAGRAHQNAGVTGDPRLDRGQAFDH